VQSVSGFDRESADIGAAIDPPSFTRCGMSFRGIKVVIHPARNEIKGSTSRSHCLARKAPSHLGYSPIANPRPSGPSAFPDSEPTIDFPAIPPKRLLSSTSRRATDILINLNTRI
jgi:hypothetical protein